MAGIKVGILTMSDGRIYLHNQYEQLNFDYQHAIAEEINKTGEFEAVEGKRIINSNTVAKEEAMRLAREGCILTIFNYAIWCYPQYTAAAANFAPGPFLLFSNLHPSECGMVGMLAASGTLNQLGIKHKRLWGSIHNEQDKQNVLSFLRAAAAVKSLKGMTFGNFGGRPLGMYTAVSNLDEWQKLFGIDVENIEQEDICREGNSASTESVDNALAWLEQNVGRIEYDGAGLTKEKLKTQIRSYYGLRKIRESRGLDFIGIKAHGDMTDHYVTMDVAEAFLNDPYDWDDKHEPIVAATEADMDGALTMQIFKLIAHTPVLFADVRHYDSENDVWFFSNSGTHATYFAGHSFDPVVNLKNVTFYPETHYYPAGGASVHHFAKAGKVTLARLARKNGQYILYIVPGEFVEFEKEKMERMGSLTTKEWPCAFTKLNVTCDRFLNEFPCNHIHGVYGNYIEELKTAAYLLNIETIVLE